MAPLAAGDRVGADPAAYRRSGRARSGNRQRLAQFGLDRGQPRLPGYRLDDAVHQPAETDELAPHRGEASDPGGSDRRRRERPAEDQRERGQRRGSRAARKGQSATAASRSARAAGASSPPWFSVQTSTSARLAQAAGDLRDPSCSNRYRARRSISAAPGIPSGRRAALPSRRPSRSNRRAEERGRARKCGRAARSRRGPICGCARISRTRHLRRSQPRSSGPR